MVIHIQQPLNRLQSESATRKFEGNFHSLMCSFTSTVVLSVKRITVTCDEYAGVPTSEDLSINKNKCGLVEILQNQ